ncbi:hypothetical protein T484DRAFT_1805612 [Baffinella frigidus]|nr:hypothetical protein T484DRAFT_1805612 [Cryptophyta sp. CCMP2293]
MTAVQAPQPLPKQAAVTKPPRPSWSSLPVSTMVRPRKEGKPRQETIPAKAFDRKSSYCASFNSIGVEAREESRGDQLRKQMDPRGHLLEFLRDSSPKPETPHVGLRGVVVAAETLRRHARDGADLTDVHPAGSFRRGGTMVTLKSNTQFLRRGIPSEGSPGSGSSDGSPDDEEHASPMQTASPVPTPSPSLGPRAQRRFVEAARLVIRNAHPTLSTSPSEHESPLPKMPPSPGPAARRKFADAARLVIRDAHPALSRSASEHSSLATPLRSPGGGGLRALHRPKAPRLVMHDVPPAHLPSDPGPARPSSESKIRIMWQPPCNLSFMKGFFPERPPLAAPISVACLRR